MSKQENQQHVDYIAACIEAVDEGRAYLDENGDFCTVEPDEDMPEDVEEVDFWNYFDDALDIEYTVGSDREYRSVRIMVACGGPNIYVDTRAGEVQLYWWNERATAYISRRACDSIDEVFEEVFAC